MKYRVIPLEIRDGLTNTSMDEALVTSLNSGPIVLFTSWNPTVSISWKQNLREDVNVKAAERDAIDIVRRKSGGRAVYLDEGYVGFTVIQPRNGIENPTHVYDFWMSKALGALHELDIGAKRHGSNDIVVNGKKIGNAAQQQLTSDGIKYTLVHGSIRSYVKDFDVMMNVLQIAGVPLKGFSKEARGIITSAEDETNSNEKELYNVLQKHLCPNGTVSSLSKEEKANVKMLKAEYSKPEWINGTGDEPSRGPCDFIFDKELMIQSLRGKVTFL
ncbi:MAG: lipoate--protein ligase family protein [Candidatus Aenigmarchaeota archaeon]|nr:lipoate--protein ligase family protein [Candidatus Aenigmarchaeota archaeon]